MHTFESGGQKTGRTTRMVNEAIRIVMDEKKNVLILCSYAVNERCISKICDILQDKVVKRLQHDVYIENDKGRQLENCYRISFRPLTHDYDYRRNTVTGYGNDFKIFIDTQAIEEEFRNIFDHYHRFDL